MSVPTCVLYGGASEQWVHNAARALDRVLPHSGIQRIEDRTHEIEPSVLAPIVAKHFGS